MTGVQTCALPIYRNPLFEELSKKYDITVYFCKATDNDRKWSTNLNKYSFKYKILKHKQIGPFVINPTIKQELRKKDYDIYILGENPENAFSIIQIMKSAKKNNRKIILWNERIDNEVNSLRELKFSKNFIKNYIYKIIKFIYKKHRDRKSTRLNSSHIPLSRMPSSA